MPEAHPDELREEDAKSEIELRGCGHLGALLAPPRRRTRESAGTSLDFENQRTYASPMRLSDRERHAIVSAVHRYDAEARVFLFGSRVDDEKKGGDIDLLVRSETIGPAERRQIRRAICDSIGEQRIDFLVAADLASPMARLAQDSGVLLSDG